MSKSNIVLAIIAGSVIGGIIALVLKTENALFHEDAEGEADDEAQLTTEKIARQFSDKFYSELENAENKIKSALKRNASFDDSSGEQGVFL